MQLTMPLAKQTLRCVIAVACTCLPSAVRAQPTDRPATAPATPAVKDYTQSSVVIRLMAFDKNGDGQLTKEELTDPRLHRLFDLADTQKTGVITQAQLVAVAAQLETEAAQNGGGRGGPGGRGPGRRGPGGPGGGGPGGGPGRGEPPPP